MSENTFKTRLRTARKMRGMSQEDLAKAASIKQPSLSALETGGTKDVTGTVLLALAKALKVRPEWLLNDSGPMEPDIKGDELQMLAAYRKASPRWRIALQHLAVLPSEQQDKVSMATLSFVEKMAAPAVSDEAVEMAYGVAPKKKRF